jgi:hypothetical protein
MFNLYSCKPENPPVKNEKIEVLSLQKKKKTPVVTLKDDFQDFKKKEEKCETEEELLKKQFAKKKVSNSQVVQLQGSTDSGCKVP